MTAGELIEMLKTVDPDMEVTVCAPEECHWHIVKTTVTEEIVKEQSEYENT